MPPDDLSGIFKRGFVIRLPDQREQLVRRLARRGFLSLEEEEYVRCLNPRDKDQRWVRDRTCDGIAVLSPDKDPDNYEVLCSDCGRPLFPRKKEMFRRLRLHPDYTRIRAWLRTSLSRSSMACTEQPEGLFRLAGRGGDVLVCLIDRCADRRLLESGGAQSGFLATVVANARDFRHRAPAHGSVYTFLDLVEQGDAALLKEVRMMGKVSVEAGPVIPAVLLGPALTMTGLVPPLAAPDERAALPHLPVPPRTWSQLSIYMHDGTTVVFRVPGAKPRSYSNTMLRMSKGTGHTPTKKWYILVALCGGRKNCGWRGLFENFDSFKTQVSELRIILKAVVGLEDDPFEYCTEKDGLRSIFDAGPPPEEETWVGDVYEE